MDASSAIGAASAALGATFRILEKGYEISAVDDQAKSVLKTVDQVSGQLRDAKTLRRQKSSLFTKFEKRMIDGTLQFTQEAISLVATLVEPARADLEVTGGSIRFPTRLLFVLRDSPRIQVCLTQLGIASQSLNRDLAILCEREGRPSTPVPPEQGSTSAPPPYEEVVFLTEQRARNTRRKGSAMSLRTSMSHAASTTSLVEPDQWRSGAEEGLPETQVSGAASEDESEESCGGVVLSQSHGNVPELILTPSAALRGSSEIRPQICGRQRSLRWLETRT